MSLILDHSLASHHPYQVGRLGDEDLEQAGGTSNAWAGARCCLVSWARKGYAAAPQNGTEVYFGPRDLIVGPSPFGKVPDQVSGAALTLE